LTHAKLMADPSAIGKQRDRSSQSSRSGPMAPTRL
jgi:hypothetical protein